MDEMTYDKFLRLLMFNRVYDSETITFLIGNNNKASRYRQKGLSEGHIKKKTYKKRERTIHSTTLFSLTKKGIQYIGDHDEFITQSMALNELEQMITAMRRDDRKGERKEKIARDTSVLTFASKAGMAIPYDNYTASTHELQGDAGKDAAASLSIDDYMRLTLSEEKYTGIDLYEKQTESGAKIVFHNGICIKAFSGEANSFVGSRDYAGGRYSGVADSSFKSVFLYASPMFGMRWNRWQNERELASYRIWRKARSAAASDAFRRSGSCAAMIVESPKKFAGLYFDIDKMRSQNGEELGGSYDHFYILPFSKEGTEHVRWLMTTDDEEVNRQAVEDAVNSGAYIKNSGINFQLFPLINSSGEKTAIGFQLDVKKLISIERIANMVPDQSFNILCFKWQIPYYEAVIPQNVNLTSVDLA